jgi:hypothetical protein
MATPKRPSIFWVAVITFPILWIGSIWLVPLAVQRHFGVDACSPHAATTGRPTAECSKAREMLAIYGTFGDMFGAVNALFSGLALAGVALTLIWQTQEQMRQAKPFLIARMDPESEGGVFISKPSKTSAKIAIPFEVDVPLTNASDEAALNVHVELKISDCDLVLSGSVPVPIAGKASHVIKLRNSNGVSGENAAHLVDALINKDGVVAALSIKYSSLSGVRWKSGVKYRLRLSAVLKDGDARLLKAAIDDLGEAGDDAAWTTPTKVQLDVVDVEDSWSYHED